MKVNNNCKNLISTSESKSLATKVEIIAVRTTRYGWACFKINIDYII